MEGRVGGYRVGRVVVCARSLTTAPERVATAREVVLKGPGRASWITRTELKSIVNSIQSLRRLAVGERARPAEQGVRCRDDEKAKRNEKAAKLVDEPNCNGDGRRYGQKSEFIA